MEMNLKVTVDGSPALLASIDRLADAVATLYKIPVAVTEQPQLPPPPEVPEPAESPESSDGSDGSDPSVQSTTEVDITNEDLKTYTDILLKNLTGEDYARQSTDPKTVSIVKQCGKIFREIAAKLGENERDRPKKPTDLPQSLRQRFVDELNNILVHADGSVIWQPF